MANKFIVRRSESLDFLGADWKDCYIEVAVLSTDQLKENLGREAHTGTDAQIAAANVADNLEFAKSVFLGGKGYTADGIVDLTADDIGSLPTAVMNKMRSIALGEIDPNSKTPSTIYLSRALPT